MKNISLYIPKLEDYWYEQKIESDPDTMSYNAGWDVSYFGYHPDTGCIDFPKERWQTVFDKRNNQDGFYAYIKDNDTNEFVGYTHYQFSESDNKYYCGILIEAKYRGMGYSRPALELLCETAKNNGIKELYDDFETDRYSAINLFKSVGFKEDSTYTMKRFNKDTKILVVKKEL
ncbi:MAG: GNAT family N-acetyltransferase [Bacilli bacterium]|nr:GNAT family N-acetyltransferase [Bacilli bacterium]